MPKTSASPVRAYVIWTIALICLFLFFWIATQYLSVIVDDAFISFRYAKHLAEGKGLVFNEGERVEGYTNLLWILLMAPAYKAGLDLRAFSQVLSVLCAVLLVLSVTLFAKSSLSDPPVHCLSYVAPVLLALNPLFLVQIRTGLETLLFSLLMFLSVALYHNSRRKGFVPYLTGIVLGLGYLTRPEAALWAVAFLAIDLLWVVSGKEKLSKQARETAKWGCVLAVIVISHLLWRFSYYRDWLPNTYYVKGVNNLLWGLKYTKDYLLSTGFLPIVGLFAVLFLKKEKWVLCAFLIISLLFVYNLMVGGDWIFTGRFFYPSLPLVYLLVQELLAEFSSAAAHRANSRRFKRFLLPASAAVVIVLFLFGSFREWPVTRKNVAFNRELNNLFFAFSEAVTAHTRPTDTIAVLAAGIIPYYSDRQTIDMLGLNDRHIAHSGKVYRTYLVGHQRADCDYVLDRKPRLIQLASKSSMHDGKVAANDLMLQNPRFWQLYEPTTITSGNLPFLAYELKEDPLN